MSSPEQPPQADAKEAVAAPDLLALINASLSQAGRLDGFSRAVLERVQGDCLANIEFGAALTRCGSPAEAFALYNRWLAERSAIAIADAPRFAQLWAKLYDPASLRSPRD